MFRGKVILLVMVLAVALAGVQGFAMPIHYEEGSLQVTGVEASVSVNEGDEAPEAVEVEIDVTDLQLLGRAEDGKLLIFADGRFLEVDDADVSDLISKVGALGMSQLSKTGDYEPLGRNDRNDNVKALQEMLIQLGNLKGRTDGHYGGQTSRAISDFQKSMGLEATGNADQLLQMLIGSAIQNPLTITADVEPEDPYGAIAGKTESSLDGIEAYGLSLDYDDIEGTGLLSDGTVLVYNAEGESDIDSYDFGLQFALLVSQNEDGEIDIAPAVCVSCTCVRRPIMQEIILKSGDTRCTLAVSELSNTLYGAKSVEIAKAPLTEEGVELLANAAEEGELKIRINCKYQSFDLAASESELASAEKIGKAAKTLY